MGNKNVTLVFDKILTFCIPCVSEHTFMKNAKIAKDVKSMGIQLKVVHIAKIG